MRYLVTGGCGFIGSHVVERLLGEGHSVIVMDNLSSGKRENIPSSVECLVEDITVPAVYDSIIDRVDGVFHLAAIVSVQQSAQDWLRTHQVNLGGLVALFDALLRHKRKIPVVFASSAAVYGDCQELPIKETVPCAPLSAYGADKLGCELHSRVAALTHGIPAIGLRFFNVYGPRQDPSSPYSGVISIFASRMQRHELVTIYGDGEQSRDFIHVSDVVTGLATAMQKLASGQLVHAILNLCTGTQTTINQLARLITEELHSRSTLTHAERRSGDIRISVGDPTRAKEVLGCKATMTLREGIRQILAAG